MSQISPRAAAAAVRPQSPKAAAQPAQEGLGMFAAAAPQEATVESALKDLKDATAKLKLVKSIKESSPDDVDAAKKLQADASKAYLDTAFKNGKTTTIKDGETVYSGLTGAEINNIASRAPLSNPSGTITTIFNVVNEDGSPAFQALFVPTDARRGASTGPNGAAMKGEQAIETALREGKEEFLDCGIQVNRDQLLKNEACLYAKGYHVPRFQQTLTMTISEFAMIMATFKDRATTFPKLYSIFSAFFLAGFNKDEKMPQETEQTAKDLINAIKTGDPYNSADGKTALTAELSEKLLKISTGYTNEKGQEFAPYAYLLELLESMLTYITENPGNVTREEIINRRLGNITQYTDALAVALPSAARVFEKALGKGKEKFMLGGKDGKDEFASIFVFNTELNADGSYTVEKKVMDQKIFSGTWKDEATLATAKKLIGAPQAEREEKDNA